MRDHISLSVLCLFVWAAAARAGGSAAFPEGTREFSLSANYTGERTGDDQSLGNITAAYGYYFLDNAAIEVQLLGYRSHDDEDGYGAGANFLARYHFLTIDRYSLYGDVLGGAFWVSQDFPTGGTEFNFTYAGGPGLAIRLRDHLNLVGGMRFQHVSNLFIEGRDRNPIMNGLGGYIGLMWTF